MELEPRIPTVKGSAEMFTGDVYIDAVAQAHGASPVSIALVRFAPGAHSAWHAHSIGQSLYVTEGEGRIQTRGEPIVALRAGDRVFAPAGEWHWHGASPNHFMIHLAISEGIAEVGEHVSEDDYQGTILNAS